MNKKAAIEIEKVILLIIAIIVLILILVFVKGSLQESVSSFLSSIKEMFK